MKFIQQAMLFYFFLVVVGAVIVVTVDAYEFEVTGACEGCVVLSHFERFRGE